MPAATSTADRILDAAEALFAERGLDATTITAIIETSGARNKSAVAYHFGTKMDLLHSVLARHASRLDARRDQLLDEVDSSGAATLDALARAMVVPVAELLGDASGERYLQIQAGLLGYRDRGALPELARDPGHRMVRLQRMLQDAGARASAPATALIPSIVFHGLADAARRVRTTPDERHQIVEALQLAVAAILRGRV
jgi:AcrR family transcriptional regulator